MKKIILLFCLGFILNSCMKESLGEVDIDSQDETYIALGLKVPSSVTPTRAGSSKDTDIEDIAILVYDKETRVCLYGSNNITPTEIGNGGAITFIAKVLVTDKPVLIHVFANSQEQIKPSDYKGKLEAMALESVASMNLSTGFSTALPMHGVLELKKISVFGTSSDVTLCRSVARVDVKVSGTVSNFKLRAIYAYFSPDRGYFAQTSKVAAPNLPSYYNKYTFSTVTNDDVMMIENQLFIYENKNVLVKNGSTRIVVEGAYSSGSDAEPVVSFYPIDFINPKGTNLIDVLRNYQYIFNITKVGSYGYNSADEASKGTSANITTEVIEWNQSEHNDIVFDGTNYFSVEKKELTIKGDANIEGALSVASSIPSSEWEMKWANSDTYSKELSVLSSTFKVTKPSSGNSGFFTFKTRNNYTGTIIEEILDVKVRNLKMQFVVKQVDSDAPILTVGGKIGTVEAPLIYHELAKSADLEILTGSKAIGWKAVTSNAHINLSAAQGSDKAIFFISTSPNNTNLNAKYSSVTISRAEGAVEPVTINYVQEGRPDFTHINNISLFAQGFKSTVLLSKGSHNDHYEWTATLTSFVKESGSYGALEDDQILVLAKSTNSSAVANTISGYAGETLIIKNPRKDNDNNNNVYRVGLSITYKRKGIFTPAYSEVFTTEIISNGENYKLGDIYPRGATMRTAEGIVVRLEPLSIIGKKKGKMNHAAALRLCAEYGDAYSLPITDYFETIPENEVNPHDTYGENLYNFCRTDDPKNDAIFWTNTIYTGDRDKYQVVKIENNANRIVEPKNSGDEIYVRLVKKVGE